jgi:hypothetical protein
MSMGLVAEMAAWPVALAGRRYVREFRRKRLNRPGLGWLHTEKIRWMFIGN